MRKMIWRQAGLTLLELVVSLLVLTVLTTVAIRSVGGIQEQARYEKTKNLLEEFRRAILGDGDWSSGVFGYAFDLATWPMALRQLLSQCSDPSCSGLVPMWDASLAAISYLSTSTQTQALGYGWRGPYLAVSASADDPAALRDGFGGGEGTLANVTNYGWGYAFDSTSMTIQSYGADRKPGPLGVCGQDADYEEDCALKLLREEYRFTPGSITVTLTPPNTGSTRSVFLAIFARDVASLDHLAAAFSNSSATVNENGATQSLTFTFSNPLTAGSVLIGLFRCDSYSPCPPANLTAFRAGDRRIYPNDRRLLYWQVRPKSYSFVIPW